MEKFIKNFDEFNINESDNSKQVDKEKNEIENLLKTHKYILELSSFAVVKEKLQNYPRLNDGLYIKKLKEMAKVFKNQQLTEIHNIYRPNILEYVKELGDLPCATFEGNNITIQKLKRRVMYGFFNVKILSNPQCVVLYIMSDVTYNDENFFRDMKDLVISCYSFLKNSENCKNFTEKYLKQFNSPCDKKLIFDEIVGIKKLNSATIFWHSFSFKIMRCLRSRKLFYLCTMTDILCKFAQKRFLIIFALSKLRFGNIESKDALRKFPKPIIRMIYERTDVSIFINTLSLLVKNTAN